MWSLNPLLLFVIMADGHNDVLAAALAATALFAVRKSAALHTFWGGVLLVLAIGVKATYALFGAGMAWAVRRSPRALFALAAGAAAVLVPTYLLGGPRVIEATTFGLVSGEHTNLLWYEFAKYTGHRGAIAATNVAGLLACGALALVLLWRLPPGPPGFPGVRVTLALVLALLIASPYQQAWYDAMIFPLLAVTIASRLDWVVAAHTVTLSFISVPYFYPGEHPSWWSQSERYGTDALVFTLAVAGAALLWLCWTRDWRQLALEAPLPGARVISGRTVRAERASDLGR